MELMHSTQESQKHVASNTCHRRSLCLLPTFFFKELQSFAILLLQRQFLNIIPLDVKLILSNFIELCLARSTIVVLGMDTRVKDFLRFYLAYETAFDKHVMYHLISFLDQIIASLM